MIKNKYRKVFDFGKIDYYGRGRKLNAVEIEMAISEDNRYSFNPETNKMDETRNGYYLSIMGGIYNAHKTDAFTCGQCDETIKERLNELEKPALAKAILNVWNLYHLKNLRQIPEEALNEIENIMGLNKGTLIELA